MKLERQLGLRDVIGIACGAMFSGLFILPGLAFPLTGPALLASFALASLLAISGMLSQAELVSAMPKAGGAYFFVSRSMGPTVGSIYGFVTWLSLCLKSSMELLACAALVAAFTPLNPQLTAIVLCLLFLVLNLVGVKEAGRIQVIFITVILLALLMFNILGFTSISVDRFAPFAPGGFGGVLTGAGMIFIAFGGLLKVASIAEEVQDPGRNLPRGMIYSLLIIIFAYVATIFTTIGVTPAEIFSGSTAPVSDAAAIFLGTPGRGLFAFIAALAILSAANAGILAASRYPLALSRDGLVPQVFGTINERFHTPHVSIFVTGLLICAALFLPLETVVKAASAVLILTYIFSCISTIIMRESRLQNYQPQFHSPLYPWVQIFGIVGFTTILVHLGGVSLLIATALILAAISLYWYYRGTDTNREFALLHLIERITSRDLTAHLLETELKEILQERDNILKDSFDHLIEDCEVIDIERSITSDELFQIVSDALAPRLGLTTAELKQRLVAREEESSTVLSPYLAIPHVVIEGEKHFGIMMLRSREGIMFSPGSPHVHAVFLLVGTRDMRQLHLWSLAAIAQIVQDEDFEQRWQKAKSEEALRDIVLLTKRKRQISVP